MYTCLMHKKFYSVTLLIHEQYKCKIDREIDFIHSHMSHWHLIDNEYQNELMMNMYSVMS